MLTRMYSNVLVVDMDAVLSLVLRHHLSILHTVTEDTVPI